MLDRRSIGRGVNGNFHKRRHFVVGERQNSVVEVRHAHTPRANVREARNRLQELLERLSHGPAVDARVMPSLLSSTLHHDSRIHHAAHSVSAEATDTDEEKTKHSRRKRDPSLFPSLADTVHGSLRHT